MGGSKQLPDMIARVGELTEYQLPSYSDPDIESGRDPD